MNVIAKRKSIPIKVIAVIFRVLCKRTVSTISACLSETNDCTEGNKNKLQFNCNSVGGVGVVESLVVCL